MKNNKNNEIVDEEFHEEETLEKDEDGIDIINPNELLA
jgi:hypothetical protein